MKTKKYSNSGTLLNNISKSKIMKIEANPEGIDWKRISYKNYLTEEFIDKYKDYLDWSLVSNHQPLTLDMIYKYGKYVDWSYILEKYSLTEEILEKYMPIIGLYDILATQDVSIQFIEKYSYAYEFKRAMETLSRNNRLSEKVMNCYLDHLNWNYLSNSKAPMSEEFINNNSDKLDMVGVYMYKPFSINLLKKHFHLIKKKGYTTYKFLTYSENYKKTEIIKFLEFGLMKEYLKD